MSLQRIISTFAKPLDFLLLPFGAVAALILLAIRRAGIRQLPLTRAMFRKIGVFPIRDHYYEPMFDLSHLRKPLEQDRILPGIDWNDAEQLALLENFDFNKELRSFGLTQQSDLDFYYHNGAFESGDAELLYNMIRHFKPKRIIEIGSGQSTKLAKAAVLANRGADPEYDCDHVCIEPYEAPWLEALGVRVLREKVENIEPSFFGQLREGDILFIDSSHMIRPQGDVLYEYLEILPILASGVLIHVHDIFSPRDYLKSWLDEEVFFWNEQYLLEAFLNFNSEFKILSAANYLKNHFPHELTRVCPVLGEEFDARQPGSIWLRRV